jgi:hypothetical protein
MALILRLNAESQRGRGESFSPLTGIHGFDTLPQPDVTVRIAANLTKQAVGGRFWAAGRPPHLTFRIIEHLTPPDSRGDAR